MLLNKAVLFSLVERLISCVHWTTTFHTIERMIASIPGLCTIDYKEIKKMHREVNKLERKEKKTHCAFSFGRYDATECPPRPPPPPIIYNKS